MVHPSQATPEDKLKTMRATFDDCEQRMTQYVKVRDSILQYGTAEFARREQQLMGELREKKDSSKVYSALIRERHLLANQKTDWYPVAAITEFFTEVARFYATASPQHRQEIVKLFEGHRKVVSYFESFLNHAAKQMQALPDEADVWFGMAR